MTSNLPLLNDANVRGKRVLLRLDLNLPIVGGKIQDEFRLRRSLPTLEYLKKQGAKTIILSHTDSKETDSLKGIAKRLNESIPITFLSDFEKAPAASKAVGEGEFLFLENVRRHPGEIRNDEEFAKTLASLGEIYINDAFAVSQREHASIVGIPKFLKSYVGPLFMDEISYLSKAFNPERPFLFVLGGANKHLTLSQTKTETKFPLIRKFLDIADTVYVCGALANDVYKARGYETGASLVSDIAPDAAFLENQKLQVPSDVIVRAASGSMAKPNSQNSIARPAENGSREKGNNAVEKTEKIVDVGSDALADLRALIEKAKFVLWNGPLGEYESGFDAGTIALAQLLAECDAETIIGGGDTLAVVSKLGLLERFSFVSTGGGAMLEFLANGTLPGIEALKRTV